MEQCRCFPAGCIVVFLWLWMPLCRSNTDLIHWYASRTKGQPGLSCWYCCLFMQICNSIVIATELESFYISKRDISVEDEVFINLLFPDRTFGEKTKTTGGGREETGWSWPSAVWAPNHDKPLKKPWLSELIKESETTSTNAYIINFSNFMPFFHYKLYCQHCNLNEKFNWKNCMNFRKR